MDYLTAAETAEKWGISDRRVTKLCNEGRVKGAIRKGFMWLIPANTEKPQELKRGRKQQMRSLHNAKRGSKKTEERS